MSDKTELCKLLEERGLDYQTDCLHTFWRVGSNLYDAMNNLDGTLTVGNLTPEQAIAATTGSATTSDSRTTTSTAWCGWPIVSPCCYGCFHAVVRSGKFVCYCPSRTISRGMHGDVCESYCPGKVVSE